MKLEIYEANVSGAIFDFAAYLTTMDEAYTVGAQYNAARMADEVAHFLSKRGMDCNDANVLGWQDALHGEPRTKDFHPDDRETDITEMEK